MKKIVIDGHNLIPKMPGMALSDLDDEAKLMNVIQEYCRLARRQAELFFDGAPPAKGHSPKSGLVSTHFIRAGLSADDAIMGYLRSSGKSARNLVVVTSDRRIQAEAVSLGAECLSSDAFAAEIRRVLSSPKALQELREKKPTESEVDEFLELFSGESGEK